MHLGCYFSRVPNRAFHAWCQSMPGPGNVRMFWMGSWLGTGWVRIPGFLFDIKFYT